jgi:hypothetical protein
MSTLTVTSADIGQAVLTAGVLNGVTFTKAPDPPGAYFLLYEGATVHPHQLFNVNISTMAVSPGTQLLRNGNLPFAQLMVYSCPVGAEFELEYDDEVVPFPPPILSSIAPTTAVAGSADIVIDCYGSDFRPLASQVCFDGAPQTTAYTDATEISAPLRPADYAAAATIQVTVIDGVDVSAAFPFAITDPPPPAPTLSSLTPNTALATDADLTMTCTGTNFTATSVVNFGGVDCPTTFVSDTSITMTVQPSVYGAGTFTVLVKDGAATSASLNFAIT